MFFDTFASEARFSLPKADEHGEDVGVALVLGGRYRSSMSSITAILEADANGVLHLALPDELRKSKLMVTAAIHVDSDSNERPTREEALAALRKLRKLGTFKQITDPMAWQREIRKDRPLGSKH